MEMTVEWPGVATWNNQAARWHGAMFFHLVSACMGMDSSDDEWILVGHPACVLQNTTDKMLADLCVLETDRINEPTTLIAQACSSTALLVV